MYIYFLHEFKTKIQNVSKIISILFSKFFQKFYGTLVL